MKIGFDGRYAEGDLVGIGKYIKSLTEGLDKHGIECVIFYSKTPKYPILGKRIMSVVLPTQNTFLYEQILLPKALREYNVDIYHATGNIGIPLFSRIKSVLTVHDLIPLQINDYFSYSKFSTLSRCLYIFRTITSVRKADRIVAVSKFTENELDKKGLSYNKTSVIYSGINKFPKKIVSKEIYSNYILDNGGIDIRKNNDRLIKAFARVKKEVPDLKLVITGENKDYKQRLIKLVNSLKLHKSVIFTGYVSDSKIASLVKNAKCLCYLSLIEGFGFPILEAFYFKTPVIASNTSSIPEIARNAAILVNPKMEKEIYRAIIRILNDNKLRNNLVESGSSRVKKFNWSNSINEYLDLYNSIK